MMTPLNDIGGLLPAQISQKLRPWQIKPAEQLIEILKQHGAAIDTSSTGAGKSYTAAAAAVYLNVPTLAVVPAISVESWKRAFSHFGDTCTILSWEMLRSGRTSLGSWSGGLPLSKTQREFFQCVVCLRVVEMQAEKFMACPHHRFGTHCVQTKVRPHRYGRFQFHPGVKFIILDECHRAANDSLNAEMMIAAKRQGIMTLALSATPANSPLQMRALGYLLGLHGLANFDNWAYRKGCRRVPMRGWAWQASQADQLAIMADIRTQMRGVRLSEKDIPDFPERHISAELYTLPDKDTEALNALYADIADSYSKLQERASLDINPELPLTKRLRARQLIELLKIGVAAELGQDYIEKGNSVAFFVNFRATIDELFKRFPNARIIDGNNTKNRQQIVDDFQANKFRELIVNNQAGRESLSLHDLTGDSPRVGIVFPSDSATAMRQLFGRLARDGGKSAAYYRVIFAAKSVEVPMRRALAAKLNNLDALLDNDLIPNNLQID